MIFSSSIIIDSPREKVVRLFMDEQHLADHQEGFVRKELMEGVSGQDGSVSRVFFKHGKREMQLIETVVENRLPDSIETFIHHAHMDNTYKCSFESINDSTTRYSVKGEYVAVRGFVPKVMMKLFPGIFRKQSEKWMNNFKEFVQTLE